MLTFLLFVPLTALVVVLSLGSIRRAAFVIAPVLFFYVVTSFVHIAHAMDANVGGMFTREANTMLLWSIGCGLLIGGIRFNFMMFAPADTYL